jgi:predicted transcriptional regulator
MPLDDSFRFRCDHEWKIRFNAVAKRRRRTMSTLAFDILDAHVTREQQAIIAEVGEKEWQRLLDEARTELKQEKKGQGARPELNEPSSGYRVNSPGADARHKSKPDKAVAAALRLSASRRPAAAKTKQ